MDMNLHAVRDRSSSPSVVLYQFDLKEPMNALGLLMAYAQTSVKPVVSGHDMFTVGSRGMAYPQPLPPKQVELMNWALDHTTELLKSLTPGVYRRGWTDSWLRVLKTVASRGFYEQHELPLSFGDPTSCKLASDIIEQTSVCGAVTRHGAECFNFYL